MVTAPIRRHRWSAPDHQCLTSRRATAIASARAAWWPVGACAVWPGSGRGWHDAAVDPSPADPVLVRRRQLARGAEIAQRAGYALFGLAVVLFVVGFVAGFTGTVVTAILVALGVGSALLAPAIVIGYAVKAADREDRELGAGR